MPYVNVYLEDRSYGGPEEGGWWYTDRQVERAIPVTTHRQAERALRLAARIVERWNVGRPDIGSVLSRGRYVAEIDRQAGQSSDCPRYE